MAEIYEYELDIIEDNQVAIITKVTNTTELDTLNVPAEIDRYPVYSIKNLSTTNLSNILIINLPTINLIRIEDDAFARLNALQYINFYEQGEDPAQADTVTLKYFGANNIVGSSFKCFNAPGFSDENVIDMPYGIEVFKTFSSNYSCKTIQISATCNNICDDELPHIYGLKNITVDEDNTVYAVYHLDGNHYYFYNNINHTLIRAFELNNDEWYLEQEDFTQTNIINIASYGFGVCGHLRTIHFPESINLISGGIFAYDDQLVEITINNDKYYSLATGDGESEIDDNSLHNIIVEKNTKTLVGGTSFWTYDINTGYHNSEKIIIPSDDNIKIIGKSAFLEVRNFKHLDLGHSVEIIKDRAFSTCNILEIFIPNSIKIIEDRAFQAQTLFTSATTYGPCPISIIFEENSQLTKIGFRSFAEQRVATSITEITIPASVEEIGEAAFLFGSTNSLATLNFETNSKLKIINTDAFYNAQLTNELIIPASVEIIGKRAFSFPTNNTLTPINLLFEEGSHLKTIEISAFEYRKLNNFTLPDSIEYINNNAFHNTNITTIYIPKNVSFIGNTAFYNPNTLTTIIIDKCNTITTLDNSAFTSSPTAVRKIYQIGTIDDWLKKSFLTIDGNPLRRIDYTDDTDQPGLYLIESLEDIETAERVTEIIIEITQHIPAFAFEHYTPLTKVTINSNLLTIGKRAFDECPNIIEFNNIPNCIYDIDYYIGGFKDATYLVENNVKYLGNNNNPHLVCTRVATDNPTFNENIKVFAGQSCGWRYWEVFRFPNQVRSICGRTFYNCPQMQTVYLPASLEYLANDAFSRCPNLQLIDTYNLKAYIENGISSTTGTEQDGRLNEGFTLYYKGNPLIEVTLPNNIYKIGDNALRNNQTLTKLTIPNSVASIGENALANCPEVTDIYYLGSSYQWNEITKGANWEPNATYTLHFVPGRVWQYSL